MIKKLLIADDDSGILTSLRFLLKSQPFKLTFAHSVQEVEYFVKTEQFDLVLMDLNYAKDTTSGEEGLTLIKKLKNLDEDLAIIVMTGWASIELAVTAMQHGAGDFVQKPWDNERLISILHQQLLLAAQQQKAKKLSAENKLLKNALGQGGNIKPVANSMAMQQFMGQLKQFAATDISILLTGENGTGKSMLVDYIHQHSLRSENSLVAVNMGGISETLFESEMFGHVKGAFTDAKESRVGRFELAHQGTLFLDEIANVPLTQQAKLLRVLEAQQFEKVGSSRTLATDFRLISATNGDLQAMVSAGEFRQDLMFRINTLILNVPALRERREDIIPLAKDFILQLAVKYHKSAAKLSAQAEQCLLDYHWPGNVRELAHTMERSLLVALEVIEPAHLMLNLQSQPVAEPARFDDSDLSLLEIEKRVISQRLKSFAGNVKEAGDSLGFSRSAFYRRLDKLGL